VTPEAENFLLVSIPPTIAALGALLLGWLNSRKLAKVETKVDGRLTELLELTRKSSHAEGVRDGKQPDA
jgi:hypothetical protein